MSLNLTTKLKPKAIIDITSLIDLIFLLVAFFLVTSSLGTESSITVHLPKAIQTAEPKQGDVVISITERNVIFFDDVEVTKEKLKTAVNEKMQSLKDANVIIRGDKLSNYETVVYVMDVLNQAGIPKFSIATEE